MPDTIQLAVLKRANTLAGGVSHLARRFGLNADTVDRMLWGREAIPQWVFMRAVDFLNEAKEKGTKPPGFPDNWEDVLGDGPKS